MCMPVERHLTPSGGGAPIGFKAILKGSGTPCQAIRREPSAPSPMAHQARLEVDRSRLYPDLMTNALTASIEAAIEDIAAVADPVERFNEGRKIRAEFSDGDRRVMLLQQSAVEELKQGRTWAQVGEALGVTGSRAEQIAKGR